MMKISTLAALIAALTTGVSARPEPPFVPRNYCANDKCQQAVSRGKAEAKRDCSSFLATTITQCAITKTATRTKTVTAATMTKTAFTTTTKGIATTVKRTGTALQTEVISQTDTETVYHTDFTTQTLVVTATMVDTVTNTDVVTATVTVQPQAKRKEWKRGYSTCPEKKIATKLPSYASCCAPPNSLKNGQAAYASACSCLGVKRQTVTLPAKTVSVTTTKTITTTPTTVIRATVMKSSISTQNIATTITNTITVTSVKIVTDDVYATLTKLEHNTETIAQTANVQITETSTVTVTATPTVAPFSQPCRLQAVGGLFDGYYLSWTGLPSKVLTIAVDYASADDWFLDANNQLHHSPDGISAYAAQKSLSYILLLTQSDLTTGNLNDEAPLTCSFAADVISCSNSPRNKQFLISDSGNSIFLGSADDRISSIDLVGFKRVCSPPV